MPEQFRGGNSRSLAKSLDAIGSSVAVLDRKGQVVFVNARLCELLAVEHSQIVGQQCRWDLPEDSNPLASLLYCLAPPQAVREGKIETRAVEHPAFAHTTATQQTFLPILDEHSILDLTIVVFHAEARANSQESTEYSAGGESKQETEQRAEQLLVKLRSTKKRLDNLRSLVGESDSIRLAMHRAQTAIHSADNILIHGPAGSGKLNLARGIFDGRVAETNSNPLAAQFFVLDCSILDADLVDGLLEVLAGRIRAGQPAQCHHLVLNETQELSEVSAQHVSNWLSEFAGSCRTIATTTLSPMDLRDRSPIWERTVSQLMQSEIAVPSLASRAEDIPALAHDIVAAECRRAERAILNISADVLDMLVAYPWPRNRMQLEETLSYAVENAVLTASIQPSHLPVQLRTFAGHTSSQRDEFTPIELDQLLEQVEKKIILKAMQHSPRNRAEVARLLGISRARLLRRIDQLGLEQND